jgi:hypothetical protein
MKTITLTAPSHWASYLINYDDSGLSAEDIKACETWLKFQFSRRPAICVDAEDVGYMVWHDAKLYALPADCCEYTFLI